MGAWYHAAVCRAALVTRLGCSAIVIAACAARPAAAPPPEPPAEDLAQSPQDSGAPESPTEWAGLVRLTKLPALTTEPLPAQGHLDGRQLALVRITPEASDAYLSLAPDSQFPVGTLIAEFLIDPSSGAVGHIFAMRKDPEGRWQFAVANSRGRIERAGALPLCQRCHAEAPRGVLFGLPEFKDRR
jgi:hypothetical protein